MRSHSTGPPFTDKVTGARLLCVLTRGTPESAAVQWDTPSGLAAGGSLDDDVTAAADVSLQLHSKYGASHMNERPNGLILSIFQTADDEVAASGLLTSAAASAPQHGFTATWKSLSSRVARGILPLCSVAAAAACALPEGAALNDKARAMANALANVWGRLDSRISWTEFHKQTLSRHINMARYAGTFVGTLGCGFRGSLTARRSSKRSVSSNGGMEEDAADDVIIDDDIDGYLG